MKRHIILNWTARAGGLLVFIFLLLLSTGAGLPDVLNNRGGELVKFLAFLLPVIVGFIIAWRRPVAGGWLMIAGAILLGGYFVYSDDMGAAIIYPIPLLLVGLCFLAAGEKALF